MNAYFTRVYVSILTGLLFRKVVSTSTSGDLNSTSTLKMLFQD